MRFTDSTLKQIEKHLYVCYSYLEIYIHRQHVIYSTMNIRGGLFFMRNTEKTSLVEKSPVYTIALIFMLLPRINECLFVGLFVFA